MASPVSICLNDQRCTDSGTDEIPYYSSCVPHFHSWLGRRTPGRWTINTGSSIMGSHRNQNIAFFPLTYPNLRSKISFETLVNGFADHNLWEKSQPQSDKHLFQPKNKLSKNSWFATEGKKCVAKKATGFNLATNLKAHRPDPCPHGAQQPPALAQVSIL